MTLGKLWQRYIFQDLLKCFTFFLLSFFFLYFLIDFSTHAHDFVEHGRVQVFQLSIYYLHQFFKKLQLLLPLALLISTIKVLSSLNSYRELIALQAGGIPLRSVFRPFWLLAAVCSLAGYLNEEFSMPKSTAYLEEIKHSYEDLLKKSKRQFTILYLKDSSKLIYQDYIPEKGVFFDVYWIRSFNDIWRMKYLNADPQNPIGEYVDHIARNEKGVLEKKESYERCHLPSLKWKTRELHQQHSSPKHQKLTRLATLFLKKEGSDSFHDQGEIATHFFHKLLMPLFPFLILLGVLPYCIGYSRNPPLFLLYGVSIFCFIVFFAALNAMLILGENQIIHPFLSVGIPFILLFGGGSLKYRSLYT